MKTPWGCLKEKDLEDPEFAETVLMTDKHQLLEGLVIEREFERMLGAFDDEETGISILDIETIIALPKEGAGKRVALVWVRNRQSGLGRYLQALEAQFQVLFVEYRPEKQEFYGARFVGGKRQLPSLPLEKLLKPLATQEYKKYTASSNVRDEARQYAAIRERLFKDYGSDFVDRVLLPRLLINCGVQPWFRAVWNLDRIAIIDGTPWYLELKHKYPIERDNQPLKFGLNDGELENIVLLAGGGINTLHPILVKPVRDRHIDSLYILEDEKAKRQTAVIAKVIDRHFAAELQKRGSCESKSYTTLSGSKGSYLNYKPISASEFYSIGVLADDASTIRAGLLELTRAGSEARAVSDDCLERLKMSKEELTEAADS